MEHHEPHHQPHEHLQDENLTQEFSKIDFKKLNGKTFVNGLKDAFSIFQFKNSPIETVAHRDSEGLALALVFLLIGAFGMPLGGLIFGLSNFGFFHRIGLIDALFRGIIVAVFTILLIYVIHFIAHNFFKGQAKFSSFLRVLGYVNLISIFEVLTFIPFINWVTGIWKIVMTFFVLTRVQKMDNTNASLTLILSVAAYILFFGIVAWLGFSGFITTGGFSYFSLT